jgi:hypothetical protein
MVFQVHEIPSSKLEQKSEDFDASFQPRFFHSTVSSHIQRQTPGSSVVHINSPQSLEKFLAFVKRYLLLTSSLLVTLLILKQRFFHFIND